MSMNISEYWDERTVFIYGLLAGYTQLKPAQLVNVLNEFVNEKQNLTHSVRILKELEVARLVYFTGVIVKLRQYRYQVSEELDDDEASRVLSATEDSLTQAYEDAYQKELDLVNITELASYADLVTEALHGCLSFGAYIQDRAKLQAIFADYLNRFKKDGLYVPTKGYAPYVEQEQSILNWLGSSKGGSKLYRIGLPDTTRFLEALFVQVSEGRLAIKDYGGISNLSSPAFSVTVAKSVSHSGVNGFGAAHQRIDINRLRVTPNSYAQASQVLNLAGVLIPITKQPQRKTETTEAVFMRYLFGVKYFYDGLPIKKIYRLNDVNNVKMRRKQLKKASSLLTAINNKLPEELKGQELIKMDKLKFYIPPHYKK